MRDARGRARRAAVDRLHHGRFDFQVTARIQLAADVRNDMTAAAERLARVLIDRQVQVPLTVARFDIPSAPCHFSGRGRYALVRQDDARGADRQLARLGEHDLPLDPHDVARVSIVLRKTSKSASGTSPLRT